jgi:putative transcriptional regulator
MSEYGRSPPRPGGASYRCCEKRKVGMAIEVKLDMMLLKRKMMLKELSEAVGISATNLSLLKTGRVKGIKFSTLDKICRELDCQPGDLLEYVAEYV